jgi:hypothetical protein
VRHWPKIQVEDPMFSFKRIRAGDCLWYGPGTPRFRPVPGDHTSYSREDAAHAARSLGFRLGEALAPSGRP